MFKNTDEMPVVFTAQSKAYFYCRDAICEFVLSKKCLPLNPFRVFEYFLSDRVDRNLVRRGNNNLIRIADELWAFGMVADGVLFEIEYALQLGKPIRFFTIATRATEIREISNLQDVKFEPEIHSAGHTRPQLLARIDAQRTVAQLPLFGDPQEQAALPNGAAAIASEPELSVRALYEPDVLGDAPPDPEKDSSLSKAAAPRSQAPVDDIPIASPSKQ